MASTFPSPFANVPLATPISRTDDRQERLDRLANYRRRLDFPEEVNPWEDDPMARLGWRGTEAFQRSREGDVRPLFSSVQPFRPEPDPVPPPPIPPRFVSWLFFRHSRHPCCKCSASNCWRSQPQRSKSTQPQPKRRCTPSSTESTPSRRCPTSTSPSTSHGCSSCCYCPFSRFWPQLSHCIFQRCTRHLAVRQQHDQECC